MTTDIESLAIEYFKTIFKSFVLTENEKESVTWNDLIHFAIHIQAKSDIKLKKEVVDAFDNGQANWDLKSQDYKNGKDYLLKGCNNFIL